VAYKLMPMAGPLLLAAPSSGIAKRGAFATKALWVTPHQDLGEYLYVPIPLTGVQCCCAYCTPTLSCTMLHACRLPLMVRHNA
jgi:hypothetical protein